MLVFGQKPVTDFRAVIGKVGKMKTYQSANFILSVPNTEYRFVAVGRGGEDPFQKVFLIGYGLQVVYKKATMSAYSCGGYLWHGIWQRHLLPLLHAAQYPDGFQKIHLNG